MYKYAFPTQLDLSVWRVLLGDVSFLLVLVISYFIGVILGPFGALIRYPFWWWAKLRTPKRFKDMVRRYVSTDMKEDPFNRLEDFKRFEKRVEKQFLEHYPQDKMVLVKMWAESDMCLNVLAGIFIANMAILLASMLKENIQLWSRLQLTVVPVIAVAILGANFRHRGVIRRDFSYLERLSAPKEDMNRTGGESK